MAWLASKSGKVAGIGNEGGKVANRRHDALDKLPSQGGAVYGVGLADYRTDALGSNNGPDEECECSRRGNECFCCEEMADLVDGIPQSREGADPKDDKRHIFRRVGGSRSKRAWHFVLVP